MWKIFFEYSDKSKYTLTGKEKDISLKLARKYYNQYGIHAEKTIYQKYPKKNHNPIDLNKKIEQLESECDKDANVAD